MQEDSELFIRALDGPTFRTLEEWEEWDEYTRNVDGPQWSYYGGWVN